MTDSPLPFRDATILLQVTGPQDSTQPSWIVQLLAKCLRCRIEPIMFEHIPALSCTTDGSALQEQLTTIGLALTHSLTTGHRQRAQAAFALPQGTVAHLSQEKVSVDASHQSIDPVIPLALPVPLVHCCLGPRATFAPIVLLVLSIHRRLVSLTRLRPFSISISISILPTSAFDIWQLPSKAFNHSCIGNHWSRLHQHQLIRFIVAHPVQTPSPSLCHPIRTTS